MDFEPSTVLCNALSTIIPPNAPVSFTASANDNCRAVIQVTTVIIGFDWFAFTKSGKRLDKRNSYEVLIGGDTTILDSAAVNHHITWNVTATYRRGNQTASVCEVLVVDSGEGKSPTKLIWKIPRGRAARFGWPFHDLLTRQAEPES